MTDALRARIREGIAEPDRKRRYVRDLFGRVAPRYDLTNDVMSLGLHRLWKRRLVDLAGLRPGHVVLDLAAGTGDLALAAARRVEATVLAGDLTPRMMRVGRGRRGAARVRWVACDALDLPFPDRSLDRVLIGYGLRNFAELERGLEEIRRCLRPGGRLLALDFGVPPAAPFRQAYLAYLDVMTRAVGRLLHRDPEAYLYIPESLRAFPGQRGVAETMLRLGFTECGFLEFLWGAMAISFGRRPGASGPAAAHPGPDAAGADTAEPGAGTDGAGSARPARSTAVTPTSTG